MQNNPRLCRTEFPPIPASRRHAPALASNDCFRESEPSLGATKLGRLRSTTGNPVDARNWRNRDVIRIAPVLSARRIAVLASTVREV